MKAIRTILACIRRADEKYNLINHGDKIVVGLSGGKDSLCLLYALTLYQKFSHTDFVIQPVTLDLGFDGFNRKPLEDFCKSLGLNLIVNDSREVYKILKANQNDNHHLPCSICSKMKKAAINKVANELGFNKVAFAHHADDAVETLFMNELYGGRMATFAPKMHLERANITFIRPLILVREKDIQTFIKEEQIPVGPSICPADKNTSREEIKQYLLDTYKKFPMCKENVLTMIDNYERYDLWGKEINLQINQDGLVLKPITTPYEESIALDIRYRVYILDMGIRYEDEMELEKEKEAHAFLILLKNVPIGTIRYRHVEEGIKIERVATLPEYRRNGYTKQAVSFLANYLWEQFNPTPIFLHSMSYIISLYEKCGFVKVGEEYLEANIPHYNMIYKKEK